MSSERAWLESAKTAPDWTTNPAAANREDLFLRIDTMWRIGCEHDLNLNSSFVAAYTRARSLAATLIPKPDRIVCGYEYDTGVVCQIQFPTELSRAVHRQLVHEETT